MKRIIELVVLGIALCAYSVSALEVTDNVGKPQSLIELSVALNKALDENNIPGMQVALFNAEGTYWSQVFGIQNKQTQETVTENTLFRAGSTTKPFVALAVMKLINEGKFSLDSTLRELAPEVEFSNAWADSAPVLVIHLLEHTAGFDDMHFKNFYNVDELNISMLEAINRDNSSLNVRWVPGTRHSYSNPSYGILGYLVEKFSGQDFEQYINDNILMPLNMIQSNAANNSVVQAQLSQGFADDKSIPYRDIYVRPAGSLHSTAYELAHLGSFLLSQGEFASIEGIDAATIRLMESPQSTYAAKAGLKHGYGLGIYHLSMYHKMSTNHDWLGHNGGIDGFITSLGYSLDLKTGFVVMVNTSTQNYNAVVELLTEFLAKDQSLSALAAKEGIDESISGYYRMANPRNQILMGFQYPLSVVKIVVDKQAISLEPLFGDRVLLYHVGDQAYAKVGSAYPSGIFISDTSEGVAFQIDGQYFKPVSFISAWLPLVVLSLSVLSILLTVIYQPIWLINLSRGQLANKSRLKLRVGQGLAIASLALLVFAMMNLSLFEVGRFNWQTILIYGSSIMLMIFSLLGLCGVLSAWRIEPNLMAKYFALFTAIGLLVFATYCYYWNYVGISLWTW
ncbi:MAG: serine hydrolase domain-containing protein [Shewanella sp.]